MSRGHSCFSDMCQFHWLKPRVYQVPPSQLLKWLFSANSYSQVAQDSPQNQPPATTVNAILGLVWKLRQGKTQMCPVAPEEPPAEEGTEAEFPAPAWCQILPC